MKKLITSVISRFKLFKQPYRIGDVIDVNGESMLILGIEHFEVYSSTIIVHYTCQRLEESDYISKAKAYKEPFSVELEVKIPHSKWRDVLPRIQLGTTHYTRGQMYKITEYTAIQLKSTDLHIDMLARPVHPVDRKEAKAKLFSERRKKLKIEVL